MRDRLPKASLGVHICGEAAGRDELIYVFAGLFEQTGVAPGLGRPFCRYSAPQAFRFFTGPLVELP